MADEPRVLRVSLPMIREALRADAREWTAEEIAVRFGVLEATIKKWLPTWIAAVANVRVLRTPKGHFRGARYETPLFVEQTGPDVTSLAARIAELEAEVADLRASGGRPAQVPGDEDATTRDEVAGDGVPALAPD